MRRSGTDKLWAPWRGEYINTKRLPGCVFCVGKAGPADTKRLIIRRGRYSFAMLNRFPYNNGHVMISPYRHVGDLSKLTSKELSDMTGLLKDIKGVIDRKMRPDAYNIGMNLGKVAGAGFAGHIHIHVVPRWRGDTNFMPVIADCKVVSSSLEEMYRLLTKVA